ncbi:hypothetical protein KKH23_00675 [Patescibacteria group bacterium]|nr:hypothetical protein [Patescibacteria group bacterium]MBU0777262.1 hypothetical protein [Patescibacteria group bacterium]MBU0845708.1 hypothetical protein [Patescibacteria group bacterium]MBU0923061.1 hypothetical protein [Patescibacteria group bacterium]MBU1066612.1 hypothetical protein [Patescibacteria group bacterium]
MGNYNRNNRSGGGGYGGGGGDFRRRDSGQRQMHKAVCDECGNSCEVPFRPSGDKPIYCSSCFEKKEGGSPRRPTRRGSGGSDFGKRDNTNKQLLEQVSSLNTKLDRILNVLESGGKKKSTPKIIKAKKVVIKAVAKNKKIKPKSTAKKKTEKPTLKE